MNKFLFFGGVCCFLMGFIFGPQLLKSLNIIEDEQPEQVEHFEQPEQVELANWQYINKYKKVAKIEGDKFGIPYEFILANAILQSNAGMSSLAIEKNNHFGIPIPLGCLGREIEYAEFESVWMSYREFCKIISDKFGQNKKIDYYCGRISGMMTDPNYEKKLKNILKFYFK